MEVSKAQQFLIKYRSITTASPPKMPLYIVLGVNFRPVEVLISKL